MAHRGWRLLIGGVGYVGYNVARHYSAMGLPVVAASRASGIARRPGITSSLRRLNGVKIAYVSSPREVMELLKSMKECPLVTYILVGRISGGGLWDSNYTIPVKYAEAVMRQCGDDSLVAFSSAVAVYGKKAPLRCGTPIVEEEQHCSCCRPGSVYARAKLAAERRLTELSRQYGSPVLLARLGLVAGRRPYHREWRSLIKLTRCGIALGSDALLHLTSPRHLVSVVEYLVDRLQGADWVNIVSLRVKLSELSSLLAERTARRRIQLPMPGQRFLRLFEPLLPGVLGDISWSFHTPIDTRRDIPPATDTADAIVADLLAEPPTP